jgi:hypothetical protein
LVQHKKEIIKAKSKYEMLSSANISFVKAGLVYRTSKNFGIEQQQVSVATEHGRTAFTKLLTVSGKLTA